MTPSSELTRARRKKPRVMWTARSATVLYEAALASKTPAARKGLLDGDWVFAQATRKGRRLKRSQMRQVQRKRPPKPPSR